MAPTVEKSLEYCFPKLECDLIMKGGITSGVVYPPAILELHRNYQFRCIGGASAGAIAAAATAAAQLGGADGFKGLEALIAELRQRGKMVDLFQPSPAARPLLEVFLGALRGAHRFRGGLRIASATAAVLSACVLHTPVAMLLGAAAGGVGFAALSYWVHGDPTAALLPWALASAAGALLGSLIQLVGILVLVLPRQGFGICVGHLEESADPDRKPALTDWLFERFDAIAGLATPPGAPRCPLTFKDLEAANINLQLITTNLSELQPYIVPFKDRRFLFKEEELASYLPSYALEHLKRTAYRGARTLPPTGYAYLPEWPDLPVALGVRLSLSFPVLIAAVPLYTIKAKAFSRKSAGTALQLEESDLSRSWFSDGGICSNFPIHFFDRWLPSRPTFGITLGKMPDAEVSSLANPLSGTDADLVAEKGDAEVHLPAANRPEAAGWHAIASFFDLLGSIVDTMMSYRDTMQTQLPGFRERIVEIRLTPEEGGLNLDMDPARIDRMIAKGAEAGALLRDQFNFSEHRWVRLQALMPPLAEEIEHLRAQEDTLGWPYSDRPYPRRWPWVVIARNCLDTLSSLADREGFRLLKRKDPRPLPVLRTTPRI